MNKELHSIEQYHQFWNESFDKLENYLKEIQKKEHDMNKTKNKPELTITRIFNATPEQVYKMWTVPENFAKWYGPQGFSVPEVKLDLKVGGELFAQMKAPNGKLYPTRGTFLEIVPNEKLVFSLPSHFDDNGNPQVEMLNSMLLTKEDEGKTKMTFHIVEAKTIPGVEPLKGLDHAWGQSFDKMEKSLFT
jgi:uncharacterized protein YndB with AHSA1/START domain